MSNLDRLYLKPTEETPEIIFDKDKPEFRVTGKSYMEDATAHYNMVLAWLNLYRQMPNSSTIFKFELEYVNTASSNGQIDTSSGVKLVENADLTCISRLLIS